MNALLLSTLLFVQNPATVPAEKRADSKPQGNQSAQFIDGNWTVVTYEKNGSPMAEAKDCTVTIKDNLITFSPKDGKSKINAMRVEFTKPGMVKVTESSEAGTAEERTANTQNNNQNTQNNTATTSDKSGEAKEGVYVLTSDYLAVCLHDAKATASDRQTGGTERQAGSTAQRATAGKDTNGKDAMAKSYCSVLLKKSGSTGSGK